MAFGIGSAADSPAGAWVLDRIRWLYHCTRTVIFTEREVWHMETWVIVLLVVLLLGGGGWGYSRWR
jgi:hypothetical protein